MTRSTPSDLPIFSSAPDTRLFQPLGAIESCREQLEAMLRTDAGLGLLIGPPGTGKSLLCQVLAETLRDPFEVVLLAEAAPRDQLSLLQNILFHLNMPYKNISEGELRLSLIDRLTQSVHSRDHGLVLIVDEAQSLPNSILEEIRMITNIVRGGRSCVRTVLAGNHELEDRISQSGLESLAQRVAVRCYLHPFNQADTGNYLRATLAAAENGPSIDEEAVAAIHFATGGVPRLIAQLMRLVLQSTTGDAIHADHVNQAWANSRQLASPVLEPEYRQPSPSENNTAENNTAENNTAENDISESGINETDINETDITADDISADDIVEFGELSCDDEAPAESVAEPAATQAPAVAENMPEIAAELDRVTDSLLRISEQQYDESDQLEDSGELEDSCALEASDESEDSCQLEDLSQLNEAGEPDDANELDETWDLEDLPGVAATSLDSEFESDNTIIDAAVQWSPEEPIPADDQLADDEPVQAAPLPLVPLVEPQTLFGDGFDEEETVPGAAVSSLPPATVLSMEDASTTDTALPADNVSETDHASTIDDSCQPEHDLHSEVACISVEASTVQWDSDPLPPTPAIGTDGVGSSEPLQDDICLNDDSDMLIIEDVVDIEPAPVRGVVFDDDPTDSVDYQRLLNRMRQG
ncbi:ExeA family protein [Roseimaritima ulvae]|uniref:AAA domain (Dynein-related subfamily) n=1 Tax=Roseimaritima ulvae TaxID=980254 RepID=A0A5B9QPK4_9BACT|nr:AAA family ATPase [Roseimaritima ulvae]QEG39445.1 AAA domain (dynein-related subfamily) [Roseimaritima ulvae]